MTFSWFDISLWVWECMMWFLGMSLKTKYVIIYLGWKSSGELKLWHFIQESLTFKSSTAINHKALTTSFGKMICWHSIRWFLKTILLEKWHADTYHDFKKYNLLFLLSCFINQSCYSCLSNESVLFWETRDEVISLPSCLLFKKTFSICSGSSFPQTLTKSKKSLDARLWFQDFTLHLLRFSVKKI